MIDLLPAQLAEKLKQNQHLLIVDVRGPMEYHTYNIGGINVPLNQLQQADADLPFSLTDELIVVCSAGRRSITAAALLKQLGYRHIFNLKGGLNALQRFYNQQEGF